jgi:phosphate transport system protein
MKPKGNFMVRKRFDRLMQELRDDLLSLGSSVEDALKHALRSLQTGNPAIATWVISNDAAIDEMRHNLEERVIGLLATQQPIVARDLRLLSAVSAISTELERIGDYATSIARRVHRAPEHPAPVPLPTAIETMTSITIEMVQISLQAFLNEDEELARSLGTRDDAVDKLEDTLHDDLIAHIQAHPECTAAAVDMLDIIHALERAADRATNIGERVIYLVTSDIEELNT